MYKLIRELGSRDVGPSPTFTMAHIILAIKLIHENKSMGRQALAKSLELGEGATRTILRRLKEMDLIEMSKSGSMLTYKGNSFLQEISKFLFGPFEIPNSTITVGQAQAAIIVRGAGERVKDGILQRDQAVIHGADGATTYIYRNSKFVIPGGSSDCESDYPSDIWSVLREKLQPFDGDVIIASGALSLTRAKLGCIAAALTLV